MLEKGYLREEVRHLVYFEARELVEMAHGRI